MINPIRVRLAALANSAPPEIKIDVSVLRFNPNHDSKTGEFTTGSSGPGGGSSGGAGHGKVSLAVKEQPASAYPPANPAGKDTLERFTRPDGTFTPERQALHDTLLAERFAGKSPVEQPIITVMGGGPAAGKSVLLKQGLAPKDAVTADPDSFKEQLPEFKDLVAAKSLTAGTFTHEETAGLAKDVVAQGMRGGYNVVVDGSGDSSYANVANKVAGYRANGSPVHAHYVTVDTNTAVQRAYDRGLQTGRFVPETYLRETHRNVSRVVDEAVKTGLFDHLTVWDNNGPKAVKIAESRGKNLTVFDAPAWKRFLAKGSE